MPSCWWEKRQKLPGGLLDLWNKDAQKTRNEVVIQKCWCPGGDCTFCLDNKKDARMIKLNECQLGTRHLSGLEIHGQKTPNGQPEEFCYYIQSP